jgi:hypothetical protein
MGHAGPVGFASSVLAAGIAAMVGLGLYGYFREKKRYGYWKAGFASGAAAAGVGAALHLGLSFLPSGPTAGLVSMQPVRGLEMQRLGLLSSQRIGAMPTVVAGLAMSKIRGGCLYC